MSLGYNSKCDENNNDVSKDADDENYDYDIYDDDFDCDDDDETIQGGCGGQEAGGVFDAPDVSTITGSYERSAANSSEASYDTQSENDRNNTNRSDESRFILFLLFNLILGENNV